MTTSLLETYSITSVLEAPVGVTGTDMIVRDVKVFKVGAFRNSNGQRNEWTADRLQRAVDNFNTLRRSRIFPDVPIRLDHTKSMRDVVGYFHELRFDGTYLVADIMFTKKSAYDEYQGGHLRNVSLEIGQYETNDEVLYDDVVQGLAFVDIPAVEGLHQRPTGEETMGTKSETPDPQEPVTDPQTPDPTKPDPATPDPATPAPDPATPAPDPAPAVEVNVNEHGRGTVQTFRVNGREISDHAAVQTHIDGLEKFIADTRTATRNSFVDDLVKGNKILAAQTEAFQKHVASLDDEQFTAFRSLHETLPAANLFGKHDTTTSPDVAQAQDRVAEVALAREIIQQFRRQGKDQAFIERQPQWKTVQAADAAVAVN